MSKKLKTRILELKSDWIQIIVLLFCACLTRLLFLGSLPPGQENAFWLRLPSAFTGILSIILLFISIRFFTRNTAWAFMSGFALLLMPMHIEQSRVIFPLNSLWLLHPPYVLPSLSDFLSRIFKLTSVEFLFFQNDTFWWGGLRTYGVMLPITLPIFFLGFFELLRKNTRNFLLLFLSFFVIAAVTACAPFFPESREFIVVTPILATILGLGGVQWVRWWQTGNMYRRLLLVLYVVVLLYEYLVFYHFYTTHYPKRIMSEVSYEKRVF